MLITASGTPNVVTLSLPLGLNNKIHEYKSVQQKELFGNYITILHPYAADRYCLIRQLVTVKHQRK